MQIITPEIFENPDICPAFEGAHRPSYKADTRTVYNYYRKTCASAWLKFFGDSARQCVDISYREVCERVYLRNVVCPGGRLVKEIPINESHPCFVPIIAFLAVLMDTGGNLAQAKRICRSCHRAKTYRGFDASLDEIEKEEA